ncbi:alpha/beta hydrolase [Dermatophilus congolensis]|nr:alpha/beta fold hydrolase [Dermatophilus congolensis]
MKKATGEQAKSWGLMRPLALAGGAAGLSALAASAGWVGAGAYLARMLLTPVYDKPDNVRVCAIDRKNETVTLVASADTIVPGRYGVWLNRGGSHIRIGHIVDRDDKAGTIIRRLEGIDFGEPEPGGGRWDSYYWAVGPERAFGLPYEDVFIPSEVGPLPAWLVRAEEVGRSRRCAVLVHGRGATRHETLRSIPVLHRLGWDVLVPSYRNAPGAPSSADGLYNLGLSEWRDVEASVDFAGRGGASEVALFGWSMGGAVVLQMLDLSPLSSLVTRVVLDSPVVDWVDVIAEQGRRRHIPPQLGTLAQSMIGARWSRRLVGVHEPLDVARTSWQHRSGELAHPMLLIHSVDDEVVPVGPSRELAQLRTDLVRYEEWEVARHVKEWNTDPQRWEAVVADYLENGV